MQNESIWDGDFLFLEWDALFRRSIWVADRGDEWEFRAVYHDVDQLLDANAAFEAETQGKKMGDWVRIASVPEVLVQQLQLDERLRDGRDFSRWLNDSENQKFRTHRGQF
jgi:hypothetical protein